MENKKTVKTCPMCSAEFTVRDFFQNPELTPLGMGFSDADMKNIAFYFIHKAKNCGTTLAVPVKAFLGHVPEKLNPDELDFSKDCPGYCTRMNELSGCASNCVVAPLRRLLLRMAGFTALTTDATVDASYLPARFEICLVLQKPLAGNPLSVIQVVEAHTEEEAFEIFLSEVDPDMHKAYRHLFERGALSIRPTKKPAGPHY